ncbi:XdhC family protein [Altererythrobacter xixiisoli]|uniref:XdhC family protein n=1 Tax=Croceibacterium xixiisoli TaxID=1476466 RepID=A0A6I4TWK8_9SPHN|nr:XdhC family protein [Croceibacterium xixiisoli]MXO99167.1 XdhC family protein [Croceibacterium xixiisoli]
MLPDDRAALRAAAQAGVGLCTITAIEGSFSRRVGAQLAVGSDGAIIGSLADGCLERQLAAEITAARDTGRGVMRRFGAGSPLIDFRLPCGSGIDIWIDPAPDHAACADVAARLDAREQAALPLPHGGAGLAERRYIPPLRLLLFGEGPELDALATIARGAGYLVECLRSDSAQPALALGRAPQGLAADPWTAVVLLFHDHEWEQAILQWALATPAFFIGAQGGMDTRAGRLERLAAAGQGPEQLARIHSPVGVIPRAREPGVLVLSALAQIVGAYEALHPHG